VTGLRVVELVNQVEERNRRQNPAYFGVSGTQGELGGAAAQAGALPAPDRQPSWFPMQTNEWKNRASKALNHVGERELPRVDGELVASRPSAPSVQDSAPREVEENEGQEVSGNAFTFCELGDGKAAGSRPSDARESPNAVGRSAVQQTNTTLSR
jgi:hypothetical protein